jgi:hypothetical protein
MQCTSYYISVLDLLKFFHTFLGRYLTGICQGDMLAANPTLGIAADADGFN